MSQYFFPLLVMILLFLAFILTTVNANGANNYYAQVIKVMDGDTLMIQSANREERVRLMGIDAPEYKQPYGVAARNALNNLVNGRKVRVVPVEQDQYGRLVARIYLGNVDVNLKLVRDGYAWVYHQYTNDAELYAAEQEARTAQRGLWSQRQPIPPWKWRAQHRNY